MITGWLPILTFAAALGSGLFAGVCFGFSTFVMNALSRIPAPQGIVAMQSMNVAAINPLFIGVFMCTALLCVVLAIISFLHLSDPGAIYLLIGCALYLVGSFLVTMFFNVPLNDGLAAVQADSANGLQVWKQYLSTWTAWNHVRTIASLGALAAFILALLKL